MTDRNIKRHERRKIKMAKLKTAASMIWENIWPAIMPIIAIVSVFLIISWSGMWPKMYNGIRITILVALAIAIARYIWKLKDVKLPNDKQITKRLEKISNLKHQPIATSQDKQWKKQKSEQQHNEFADILWDEHQKRIKKEIKNLKTKLPKPKVSKKDPWAIRSVIVFALFIAFMAKGENGMEKIKDAWRYHGNNVNTIARIDAWIKPPIYTNLPPIFLKNIEKQKIIKVAENSELIIRTSGFKKPKVSIIKQNTQQYIKMQKQEEIQQNTITPSDIKIFKTKLTENGKIKFADDSAYEKIQNQEWEYQIIRDKMPTISFEETIETNPKINEQGWLEIAYIMDDDYGFKDAKAIIELAQPEPNARPLFAKHSFALTLPSRIENAKAKTQEDYSQHVFAGKKIKITLEATDLAGQTNTSKTREIKLKKRYFHEPLAQSLMFERQIIALDANQQKNSANTLETITTTHPEQFITDISHFLAISSAKHKIKNASIDPDLMDAIELMLNTALAIENGELSEIQQKLKDAQSKLEQALKQGASEEEINKLMEELKQAMREFMQEYQKLAQEQQRQPQNQYSFQQNTQELSQQDIEDMMQQIEDLAKSGSHEAARELLRQFEQMMSNLQFAKPRQQKDPFSEQMDKLGEAMQQQQQLMDQTHELQRKQNELSRRRHGNKDTAQKLAEAMKELRQKQQELQKQMEQIQQGFKDLGLDNGTELGEAGKAMGEAQSNLGDGETDGAIQQQSNALEAMRKGAQQLMEQMREQAGEQAGRGERGHHGRSSHDPLGRPTGRSSGWQTGEETNVPDEIDTQKAREILNAIRRKLGELQRPTIELDYLDRLVPTR